jgi:O-methyltransferase involved in polyketide biosynthesis
LKWIDAELPAILLYKNDRLKSESPRCEYLFVRADLTDRSALAEVLSHTRTSRRVLVLSEGLLVYMPESQVSTLATDLHRCAPINWWLADISGPRALQMMNARWGELLRDATFQFGPEDSRDFFGSVGWRELIFRSSSEEARRLGRSPPLTWMSRLLMAFSSQHTRDEFRRLAGVTLMVREPPLQTGSHV